jgi:hypothetical protein
MTGQSLHGAGDVDYGYGYYSEGMGVAQMVGVVMVPAEGFADAGVSFDPGYVAVPVSRFDRWPGAASSTAEGQGVAPETGLPTRKTGLVRAFSVASNIHRIRWTVDSKKLKSMDIEAVSPPFDICDQNIEFKMVLRPRVTSQERGGASFKKAKGKGSVELTCLAAIDPSELPTVTFRISIGSPSDPSKQREPRGPVLHDFSERTIGGLPPGQDEWDFSKVVDKQSKTFVVVLEVLTSTAGAVATGS